MGVLKHIITQNIDNLHFAAGSTKVAEIHGNAYKYRCISCNSRFDRAEFPIMEVPPRCPRCGGLIKGDIVMFGEPIPSDVLEICQRETSKCDCMLLLGTSGVVYPAAGFPLAMKRAGGTLIEINPNETEISHLCEVCIRAPTGKILPHLTDKVRETWDKP